MVKFDRRGAIRHADQSSQSGAALSGGEARSRSGEVSYVETDQKKGNVVIMVNLNPTT
jgi:hypothetical protein